MAFAISVSLRPGCYSTVLSQPDALNRYNDSNDMTQTLHLMKYIFPRQFSLHNVFTSVVNRKETIQPFKDYTLREQEITQKERNAIPRHTCSVARHRQCPPRRLRGEPFRMVQNLQKLHSRCSYSELVKYYCPLQGKISAEFAQPRCYQHQVKTLTSSKLDNVNAGTSSVKITKPAGSRPTALAASEDVTGLSLIDLATPHSDVSACCRAVISAVIPFDFWGKGKTGKANQEVIMRQVDRFIRLRRFESMTLHAVSQGLKVDTLTRLSYSSKC